MQSSVYSFKATAEQVGLPTVKALARSPGNKSAIRVSIRHYSATIADTITTLREGIDELRAETVYVGCFGNKPIAYEMSQGEFKAFCIVLNQVNFDRLRDQDDASAMSEVLCLIERGAGTFVNAVMFDYAAPTGKYVRLYEAVTRYLPKALRKIQR